jgi:two-component system copper resistance phosphate regulon response regulator CusR
MRLLIVEDEDRIAAFLVKGLRAHGYAVTLARTGRDGLRLAGELEPDGVILDLGLPDIDGVEVLRRLRSRRSAMPVLVLTARDQVRDKVQGLDLGADDYLTKPFAFDELLARLRARLRPRDAAEASVLRAGAVSLDLHSRRARVGDREVDLTAREFALLETFLRHPGQVLSREQVLSRVWGLDFDPESNVVDVYVRYLRRKLGGEVIETVRGMGYRLTTRPPA